MTQPQPVDEKNDAIKLAEAITDARKSFEALDFGGAVKYIDAALSQEKVVAVEEKEFEAGEAVLKRTEHDLPKFRKVKREREDINRITAKSEINLDELLDVIDYFGVAQNDLLRGFFIKQKLHFKSKSFQILNYHNNHIMLAGLENIQHIREIPKGWINCSRSELIRVLDLATKKVVAKMLDIVSADELVRYITLIRAQGLNDKDIEDNIKDHRVKYESHVVKIVRYSKKGIHFEHFPVDLRTPLKPTAINDAVLVSRNIAEIIRLLKEKSPYKIADLKHLFEHKSPSGDVINDKLIRSYFQQDVHKY